MDESSSNTVEEVVWVCESLKVEVSDWFEVFLNIAEPADETHLANSIKLRNPISPKLISFHRIK